MSYFINVLGKGGFIFILETVLAKGFYYFIKCIFLNGNNYIPFSTFQGLFHAQVLQSVISAAVETRETTCFFFSLGYLYGELHCVISFLFIFWISIIFSEDVFLFYTLMASVCYYLRGKFAFKLMRDIGLFLLCHFFWFQGYGANGVSLENCPFSFEKKKTACNYHKFSKTEIIYEFLNYKLNSVMLAWLLTFFISFLLRSARMWL